MAHKVETLVGVATVLLGNLACLEHPRNRRSSSGLIGVSMGRDNVYPEMGFLVVIRIFVTTAVTTHHSFGQYERDGHTAGHTAGQLVEV